MSESFKSRKGGCLCGNVRYEVTNSPLWVGVCHCINCQKQSGSSFSLVAAFCRDDVTVTGVLKTFVDVAASANEVWRKFCPDCGSPVLTDNAAAVEDNVIFVKAGTMDNTDGLAPTMHFWTKSKQEWYSPEAGPSMMEQQ
jgi:hypothetical protein